MRTATNLVLLSLLLLGGAPRPAHGGGNLEVTDITGRVPSPIPGLVIGRVVPARWDARCIPVQYRVNDTLDPIPNPLGPPVLTLVQAIPILKQALDLWNDIPTSFIDMRIVGTTSNPGEPGFDMVNEITFRSSQGPPGLFGFSIPFALVEDSVFVDGDDLDGDGDSDVSSAISVCADVDGDGDIEFPAGFYKAGTILDNDVLLFSQQARFTVGPPDAAPFSWDLMAAAVHEFGHSHGLAHSLTSQLSASQGRSAAMFPFIFETDPQEELNFRTLTTEDVAWSSFFYPEGSAVTGPAALGPGDVAFDEVFGLITGEVRHGVLRRPIVGANVFAVRKAGRGEDIVPHRARGDGGDGARDGDHRGVDTIVSSGFSGTIQVHMDPLTNAIESVDLLDGKYVVPVPRGEFKVGVEAIDGLPGGRAGFTETTHLARLFGLGPPDFNEQFLRRPVPVESGETTQRIDIVTSRSRNIDNFGPLVSRGFTGAPPGRYYAVRIPVAQITAAVRPGHDLVIESADFVTAPALADRSVVPVFAEALLTTGGVHADGTASVDLARPLERITDFAGQDDDFARFMFEHPGRLGARVQRGITRGQIQSLFLVLRVPTTTPFPGPGGLPPLIGLSGGPSLGLSYFSDDGGVTFRPRTDFNFMFRLVLSDDRRGDDD